MYCIFKQTRKAIEFDYWCLILHGHKLGYIYLPEGRTLAYKISLFTNKGRYSTNINRVEEPTSIEISKVLELKLPIELKPEMLHTDFSKLIARSLKQEAIWEYDKGVLLNDKPFISIASAMVAIGYSKSSIAGRRNIDTGKILKGKYTLYSKPL